MVGSGEGDVIFEKASQLLHKGRGKLWTAVWDYFVMETKVGEDMFEKQGGDTSGVNSFATRDENHPLCKPMVDHDQNGVKTRGKWQICDHVARNLLEWAGGRGWNGAHPWDGGVGVDLVSLASGAASYKLSDKGGQIGPPVVMLNQVNGVEISAMSSHWKQCRECTRSWQAGSGM